MIYLLKKKHFVNKWNNPAVGFGVLRCCCGAVNAATETQCISVAMQQNTGTDLTD